MWYIIGAVAVIGGWFALALCKVAARADREWDEICARFERDHPDWDEY